MNLGKSELILWKAVLIVSHNLYYFRYISLEIINNIATLDTMAVYTCFKNLTIKDFMKRQRGKKRHKKYFDKVYEWGKDVILEYKFSDVCSEVMEKNTPEYIKIIKKIHKM